MTQRQFEFTDAKESREARIARILGATPRVTTAACMFTADAAREASKLAREADTPGG